MSPLRRFLAIAWLFALALLFPNSVLNAQLSTRATITGTVTDVSGAVVPGATVTVTDDATKVQSVTQTNGNGGYVVPNLTVSTYSVSITMAGFKSYTVTGVELHPAETATVNTALSIGTATETVTVGATSSDVELSTPENSAYISGEQVSSLPMNGRNYQALAGLLPGVTNLQQGSAMTTGGRSTNSQLSVNGMAVGRSFYALDGVWNENTGNMTQQSVIPNPDSLEEVRVLQDNFSAQYSLLGSSVILMQTKSGTRSLHGTAWEFLRNDALNARNYYSTTIPPYKQNIFGFNVGGPVFLPHVYNTNRQKTFFFWDESYVVLHVPSQNTSQIPTANQIAGCFASPIKDPATGLLFPTVPSCNGQTGTFYQVPSARLNTSSQAYLKALYPAPNYAIPGSALNYINNQTVTTYQRDDEIKVDHYFTPSYHLLAEYFQEYQKFAQNVESPGTTPISSETDFTNNKLAQVSLTQTLSPNMINTTSIAMNIFLLNLTLVGKTDVSQVPNFSETLFYPNATYASRTPVVVLAGGLAGQGIQAARPIPHASDLDNTVGDNWSWLKGKHYLTAGVTFVFNTKRQVSGQQTNGSFTFNGNSTQPTAAQKAATAQCSTTIPGALTPTQCTQDDGVADMLLGYVGTFAETSQAPHGAIHAFSWSPYVEDRYQFNKALTLTLGLRMYHLPLPYGAPNSETNFLPSAYNPALAPTVNEFSGATNLTPGTPYSNGLLFNSGTATGLPVNFSNNHIWYFAPDGGFAWDVFGNGKTSLRGGFGESYTRIFTNQDCSFGCIANPPAFTSQNLSNLVFPSTTTWDITKAGGTANTVSVQAVNATDPNIQASPVASYSLGVQHQFPGNFVASVVGAGSRIQHLVGTWNQNQPAPFTSGGVTYDFNPLLNSNPANAGKPDNAAYWAPYQGFAAINTIYTRLWQVWNGLEVQVKHPVANSLNVTVAYTYSHNTTNLAGNGVIDPYHVGRYHGNTESLNFPHSLSITLLYQLPFFRHSGNVLEKTVLGGWRFDDITTLRSGTSLSPGLSETSQGLAARPDQLAGTSTNGPKLWKTSSTAQWFNTSAFACPGSTTPGPCGTAPAAGWGFYGNAQTGIIRGPGQVLFNMALFKEFHITEKDYFEFRAEAFNTFNHTNPGNPNTQLGNANYGKVTSALDPRILEMALRFKF
ncbi:MAG: Plug and carboxypeptidase regulatory-like domain-containing protein [Acidobacteriota bacterium]|nr:Plug and carboxypeptidase regulatory-like domain-containing protein [Acidobacteriota bacterium]